MGWSCLVYRLVFHYWLIFGALLFKGDGFVRGNAMGYEQPDAVEWCYSGVWNMAEGRGAVG